MSGDGNGAPPTGLSRGNSPEGSTVDSTHKTMFSNQSLLPRPRDNDPLLGGVIETATISSTPRQDIALVTGTNSTGRLPDLGQL